MSPEQGCVGRNPGTFCFYSLTFNRLVAITVALTSPVPGSTGTPEDVLLKNAQLSFVNHIFCNIQGYTASTQTINARIDDLTTLTYQALSAKPSTRVIRSRQYLLWSSRILELNHGHLLKSYDLQSREVGKLIHYSRLLRGSIYQPSH